MSRKRFRSIKQFLHVADNQFLTPSKLSKVEPLFEMLKKQCQQFTIFDEFINIDESMIPCRRLYSARKFIRNKPIRFGYKVWMFCGSTSFPNTFAIYRGKKSNGEGSLRSYVVKKILIPVKNKTSFLCRLF